jgi:hypothetical protein
MSMTAMITIHPRRKAGELNRNSTEVEIRRDFVETLFDRPLCEAAQSVNLCVTSFKQVCRRLGISRWPYTRIRTHSDPAVNPECATSRPTLDDDDAVSWNSASPIASWAESSSTCDAFRNDATEAEEEMIAFFNTEFGELEARSEWNTTWLPPLHIKDEGNMGQACSQGAWEAWPMATQAWGAWRA